MEQIDKCPVCSETAFSPFLKCKDYTVSQEEFQIVSCDSCGFKFTNPIPSENEIGEYYKAESYVSHSDTKKGLINRAYHTVRKITLKQKFKLVDRHKVEPSLLDIGCGTGAFLNQCKEQNWKVLGLEPDADARGVAKSRYDIDTMPLEHLAEIPDNSFDVITMWHVLEHVYHLQRDIRQFQRVLKKDGTLIVAVPNCSSKDAAIYKEYWAAYDVPIHLYHFVPKDIDNLFGQIGMKVVETLPMKFDSYYVSMLSEKYRGGNIVSAVWNGWRSNMAASNARNDYSSQIYVLKNA